MSPLDRLETALHPWVGFVVMPLFALANAGVAINVDAYPFLKLKGHIDGIQQGSGSRFTAFPPENATAVADGPPQI